MTHYIDEGYDATVAGARGAEAEDAYDALADLFLDDLPPLRLAGAETGEEAPPPATHPPAPEPRIERHASPVPRSAPRVQALVLGHLPVMAGAWAAQHARSLAAEEGRPVALLRLSAEHALAHVFGDRSTLAKLTEQPDLEAAARAVSELGGFWVIRVDATDELELAASPAASEICVLSGVDGAATVAAYRTLKALHEATLACSRERDLCVRLMGAGAERTEEAQAKIDRVALAFLSRVIRFLPPAPRIDAGSGVALLRLDRGLDVAAAAQTLVSTLESAAEPAPVPAPPAADDHPELAETRPAGSPGYAERLGLRRLRLTCPVAPAVELASDDDGRLHLLAPGADRAADLVAAEGWALANLELLRAAAGLDGTAGEVVPRVLTEIPSRDRRLLDGRFRVDLVREVRLGGESAWCCVPLNTDEAQ